MNDLTGWIGLVDETKEALAGLRADELEALAVRAETTLHSTFGGHGSDGDAMNMRELAARHRVLGEFLRATESNLDVLRRLRGQAETGRARWVR